ncbi:prtrc system protein e [Mucilaginibacter sp. 14171R-50]|uniref:prtrc system protein e n=1 Tax=Mucilaginibacter sp. 14171R-50 TaxID=2703789 RepID=UPI00138CD075|nr:prtrc system protein e [Mucilaginibacter sp. 14171R-50]QHS55198.1 prtrc system protein e [Mucilaginibacter sp. 14171R-50]
MNTQFFQQIAGLGFTGNFLLNIHQDETGVQTVSVVLKKDKAVNGLPPMLFKATASELDEKFFEEIKQPVKQTAGLITNLETYQKELEKVKKNGKNDKDKAVKTTTAETDEEKDDEPDLFSAPADDTEVKAEKKRLFDEAMDKSKELAKQMKYVEALAQLPDPADYPDKAELIESRRKEIEAGKEIYEKLANQFKD